MQPTDAADTTGHRAGPVVIVKHHDKAVARGGQFGQIISQVKTLSERFDNPLPSGWNQGCTCRGVAASARKTPCK